MTTLRAGRFSSKSVSGALFPRTLFQSSNIARTTVTWFLTQVVSQLFCNFTCKFERVWLIGFWGVTVKVLVFLTMPFEPISSDIPLQIEYLWGLKSVVTSSDVVAIVMSLLENSLENLERWAYVTLPLSHNFLLNQTLFTDILLVCLVSIGV